MTRGHGKPEPEDIPLTDIDIRGALRVVQSLDRLSVKPQMLKELVPGQARTVSLAKHIHAARAERSKVFGSELFAEPAWDILLSLYVATHEGYRLKISALCNESGVSGTTALRWIERLIELKLIFRHRNPFDNRSSFIELEAEGLRKMEELLANAWATHFPID